MKIFSLLALLVSACGMDVSSDATTCSATGGGTATGTVMGVAIGPVVRAFEVAVGSGRSIALDSAAGTSAACGAESSSGYHLVLAFCAAPAPGTYPIVGKQAFVCPGANAAALIESDTDFATATGGSITITAASSTCVIGTYSAMFASETMTGALSAVVCQ